MAQPASQQKSGMFGLRSLFGSRDEAASSQASQQQQPTNNTKPNTTAAAVAAASGPNSHQQVANAEDFARVSLIPITNRIFLYHPSISPAVTIMASQAFSAVTDVFSSFFGNRGDNQANNNADPATTITPNIELEKVELPPPVINLTLLKAQLDFLQILFPAPQQQQAYSNTQQEQQPQQPLPYEEQPKTRCLLINCSENQPLICPKLSMAKSHQNELDFIHLHSILNITSQNVPIYTLKTIYTLIYSILQFLANETGPIILYPTTTSTSSSAQNKNNDTSQTTGSNTYIDISRAVLIAACAMPFVRQCTTPPHILSQQLQQQMTNDGNNTNKTARIQADVEAAKQQKQQGGKPATATTTTTTMMTYNDALKTKTTLDYYKLILTKLSQYNNLNHVVYYKSQYQPRLVVQDIVQQQQQQQQINNNNNNRSTTAIIQSQQQVLCPSQLRLLNYVNALSKGRYPYIIRQLAYPNLSDPLTLQNNPELKKLSQIYLKTSNAVVIDTIIINGVPLMYSSDKEKNANKNCRPFLQIYQVLEGDNVMAMPVLTQTSNNVCTVPDHNNMVSLLGYSTTSTSSTTTVQNNEQDATGFLSSSSSDDDNDDEEAEEAENEEESKPTTTTNDENKNKKIKIKKNTLKPAKLIDPSKIILTQQQQEIAYLKSVQLNEQAQTIPVYCELLSTSVPVCDHHLIGATSPSQQQQQEKQEQQGVDVNTFINNDEDKTENNNGEQVENQEQQQQEKEEKQKEEVVVEKLQIQSHIEEVQLGPYKLNPKPQNPQSNYSQNPQSNYLFITDRTNTFRGTTNIPLLTSQQQQPKPTTTEENQEQQTTTTSDNDDDKSTPPLPTPHQQQIVWSAEQYAMLTKDTPISAQHLHDLYLTSPPKQQPQWVSQDSEHLVFPLSLPIRGHIMLRLMHIQSPTQRICLGRVTLFAGYLNNGLIRLRAADIDDCHPDIQNIDIIIKPISEPQDIIINKPNINQFGPIKKIETSTVDDKSSFNDNIYKINTIYHTDKYDNIGPYNTMYDIGYLEQKQQQMQRCISTNQEKLHLEYLARLKREEQLRLQREEAKRLAQEKKAAELAKTQEEWKKAQEKAKLLQLQNQQQQKEKEQQQETKSNTTQQNQQQQQGSSGFLSKAAGWYSRWTSGPTPEELAKQQKQQEEEDEKKRKLALQQQQQKLKQTQSNVKQIPQLPSSDDDDLAGSTDDDDDVLGIVYQDTTKMNNNNNNSVQSDDLSSFIGGASNNNSTTTAAAAATTNTEVVENNTVFLGTDDEVDNGNNNDMLYDTVDNNVNDDVDDLLEMFMEDDQMGMFGGQNNNDINNNNSNIENNNQQQDNIDNDDADADDLMQQLAMELGDFDADDDDDFDALLLGDDDDDDNNNTSTQATAAPVVVDNTMDSLDFFGDDDIIGTNNNTSQATTTTASNVPTTTSNNTSNNNNETLPLSISNENSETMSPNGGTTDDATAPKVKKTKTVVKKVVKKVRVKKEKVPGVGGEDGDVQDDAATAAAGGADIDAAEDLP